MENTVQVTAESSTPTQPTRDLKPMMPDLNWSVCHKTTALHPTASAALHAEMFCNKECIIPVQHGHQSFHSCRNKTCFYFMEQSSDFTSAATRVSAHNIHK